MPEVPVDGNDCFVLTQAVKYLLKIIDRHQILDRELMEFSCWVLGPQIGDFTGDILRFSRNDDPGRALEEFEDCLDYQDYAHTIIKTIKHKKIKTPKVIRSLNLRLKRRHDDLNGQDGSKLRSNMKAFQSLFSLSDDEMKLCQFFFLVNSWEQFRHFFQSHLKIDEFSGRKYLQTVMDVSPSTLDRIMGGKLHNLGIFTRGNFGLELNQDFQSLLIDPNSYLGPGSLYQRAKVSDIPLRFHHVSREERLFIASLLKDKKDVPVHIILYGPAGTGKTSFARSMAASLDHPAYEIMHDEKNESRRRRAALLACLNMTNGGEGSVMIIDEADNLLNTRGNFLFRGEVQDKGWLNSFLDEPGVRAVWIVNSRAGIEDSVLRRFSYSVYFSNFSRQKRVQLWKTIARHNNAGRFLKGHALRKLAEDYEVSAGIIDLAIKQAREVVGKGGPSFSKMVRMALEAHLRLKNQGVMPGRKNVPDPNFTLEGLNISGKIIETVSQLKTWNQKIRQGSNGAIRQYNLLFHGPPGTGKSELAKYLARELDRDLIVKRGSDLLDKYVGETEKNIAAMFAEAESREAILVVDEADSFIFGRDMAHRSWEVNMVNEFLTRMESYQGILVCTTNRFKDLDSASIRRFNQKFHFGYLNCKGVEVFYRNFLTPLCKDEIMPEYLARLVRLTNLTPGDFKNIRDVHAMKDQKIHHPMLLAALEEESRIKDNHSGRNPVGF